MRRSVMNNRNTKDPKLYIKGPLNLAVFIYSRKAGNTIGYVIIPMNRRYPYTRKVYNRL